jgi:hypothetical protein
VLFQLTTIYLQRVSSMSQASNMCKEEEQIPQQRLLSLPVERSITKVTELETIHATAEQQEEMEKLLNKSNE